MTRIPWTPGLRVAAGCLALSLVVLAASVGSAWRNEGATIPPAGGAVSPAEPLAPLARPAAYSAEAVRAAVEAAPFHPERRRPGATVQPVDPATDEFGGVPALLRLIGTVVQPDGRSAAMCQAGSDPPRVVRIGERCGEHTLRRVEPRRAVFVTATGATLEIDIPRAGS